MTDIVTALERFRDIITLTPAADLMQPGVYGKGFDFRDELGPDVFGGSRQFGLRVSGGARYLNRTGWFEVDVEAFVDYLDQADRFTRELVIVDDHRVVSTRMRQTSNWQQGTSGIMHIKPAGNAEFFPFQVADVERGDNELGRRMTLFVTVVYAYQS